MAYPLPRPSRHADYNSYHDPRLDDDYDRPPPRRYKSEKPRRRHSPDVVLREDPYIPRRRHRSHLEPVEPEPVAVTQPAGGRRARSPPPYYGSEPLAHESRRNGRSEPHRSRRHRDDPFVQHERDALPAIRDQARRSHHDDAEYHSRQARISPAPLSDYDKYRGRDGPPRRFHRSRPSSPEPRPRLRGYAAPAYPSEDEKPRRRAGSHDRSHRRPTSPPRGRVRDVDARIPSYSSRRKSAPAPPAVNEKKKPQWWQNPVVQAGARTAFSAGAQAAMQNRNDHSSWLGPKGAKVATAALGAALMDGLGEKKERR